MKLPIIRSPAELSDLDYQHLAQSNRDHDRKYGWTPAFSSSYVGQVSCHVLGPPGFDKNKPGQDHDAIVHAWHNRTRL